MTVPVSKKQEALNPGIPGTGPFSDDSGLV